MWHMPTWMVYFDEVRDKQFLRRTKEVEVSALWRPNSVSVNIQVGVDKSRLLKREMKKGDLE